MDFDRICAQFCVPNLVEKPFYYGARAAFDYSLEYGQCESISYDEYVASHTVTYFGYDKELELYYPNDDDDYSYYYSS